MRKQVNQQSGGLQLMGNETCERWMKCNAKPSGKEIKVIVGRTGECLFVTNNLIIASQFTSSEYEHMAQKCVLAFCIFTVIPTAARTKPMHKNSRNE